MTVVYEDLTVS